MIKGFSRHYIRLAELVVFFLLICLPVTPQSIINGVINKYGHVTVLGSNFITVPDETQFKSFNLADTVLIMQMKGVRIYAMENVTYGIAENKIGAPGLCEFLIIKSLDDATNKITFTKDLIHSYDPEGMVQVIKVPYYHNAAVNGAPLTCQPWDSLSKTGGVLAVIIGNTLKLFNDIDVTGRGFKGGATSNGNGICGTTDLSVYDKYTYDNLFNNSGFKGESPAIRGFLSISDFPKIFPGYVKGRGSNYSGGGGGNGRFSGGGGGANKGFGGRGGRETSVCIPVPPVEGGNGGKIINETDFPNTIFMGGGGGSSTFMSSASSAPGANGGGIVILLAGKIEGCGGNIKADGADALSVSGNTGAGGGGGGGSVAIVAGNYSTTPVTISVKGGKGGDNTGSLAEGGGGGGGLIMTNNSTPVNISGIVSGGSAGTRLGATTGTSGSSGLNRMQFNPVLNGYLFNFVYSSVSGNLVDSVCANQIPGPINGTAAVGGSGSYTYLWQKSYDLSHPATSIPSSNVKDYSPNELESAMVWFRRIVKDNVTLLTDTSKWVVINISPQIYNNVIGRDTTICYNQTVSKLRSVGSAPGGGNGSFSFNWESSQVSDQSGFIPVSGQGNSIDYNPGQVSATTWYRRIINSGACSITSSPVKITVVVTPGSVGSDQSICLGLIPEQFTSVGPSGEGTFVYQWQSSENGVEFSNISSSNSETYTSGALGSDRWFRRMVTSEVNGKTCSEFSLPVKVTVNLFPEPPLVTRRVYTLTSSSENGNQWYSDGTLLAGATGKTFEAIGSGNYYCISTVNGCSSQPSNTIRITMLLPVFDIPSIDFFSIYPSPNRGIFSILIASSVPEEVDLQLINGSGKVLWEQTGLTVIERIELLKEFTDLAPGIYYLKLKKGTGQLVRSFIVY